MGKCRHTPTTYVRRLKTLTWRHNLALENIVTGLSRLAAKLRKIVSETGCPGKDITFRLDKGLTSGAVLDTIEELGTGYVGKVKLTSTIMEKISRIKKWRVTGNGHFAANFRLKLTGRHHTRRSRSLSVTFRQPNPVNKCCFLICYRPYEVVVTNLQLNAENIWRLYNQGAIVAQVIDEIKNDFAATGIRTNDFRANDALSRTGLIAYNLLNCIRFMMTVVQVCLQNLRNPYLIQKIRPLRTDFSKRSLVEVGALNFLFSEN